MENKIEKLKKAKERAESLNAIEESIRFKSEEIDVLRKDRARVIHDLHGLGQIFNPQLCEEEILLKRVFGDLMDKYQTENESVVYDLGVASIRLGTFLMTAYLVVTVISN